MKMLNLLEKQYIWNRYEQIQQKDIDKEYLQVLNHDKQRQYTAIELLTNSFTKEEITIDNFNMKILLSAIIIEQEL